MYFWYELDDEGLEYFKDKIDWTRYLIYCDYIKISTLEKFIDYIDWNIITENFDLPDKIINKFRNKINWKIYYKDHYLYR